MIKYFSLSFIIVYHLMMTLLGQPAANLDWKVHREGQVSQFISNMGCLWPTGYLMSSWTGGLYCEFPRNSFEEHLGEGGIWIGGITPSNDTLVSVTTSWNSSEEFFPSTNPWDTIWVAEKGQLLNIPYWPDYTGFSDQDFICRYSDYNILNITNHQPLFVDVIQVSSTWKNLPLSEVILYNYQIIPTQFSVSKAYIAFWLDGNVGYRGQNWAFALDDYSVYFPQTHLALAMDQEGGEDGSAFSPLAIRIYPPENIHPDSLHWTFIWYEGGLGSSPPTNDNLRYREMSSGIIMPDQGSAIGSQFFVAFGPVDLTIGDTLQFKVGQILGNGMNGILGNVNYLDHLVLGGTPQPDLIIESLRVDEYSADSVLFYYDVKNVGDFPANLEGPTLSDSDNVSIMSFFSEDRIYNNGNDILANQQIIGPSPLGILNPGDVYTGTFTTSYPPDSAFLSYLTLMIDNTNRIIEISDLNNTNFVSLYSGPEIIYPASGHELFALPLITPDWQGIRLSFALNLKDSLSIDYAWSVDEGDWHWSTDTLLYISPQEFMPHLTGDHIVRVTWGVNQQVIDPLGDSVLIHLVEPSFQYNRLIIDETDESLFTGGLIAFQDRDALVDSFYAEVFNTWSQWDFQSQGMPSKSVMGQYKLLIWHADNPFSNPAHAHKLPEQQEDLADYLNVGGDLVIGGWRLLRSFDINTSFPMTYQAGSFIRDYLKIWLADETALVATDFSWAAGMEGFSDVSVDTQKMAEWPYLGKLGQITVFPQLDQSSDTIYTYQNEPTGFPNWRDEPCGVSYRSSGYQTVFLGFPVFFIEKGDAEVLGEEILQHLGYDPSVIEGPVVLPGEFTVHQNYPNPFNSGTIMEFDLPEPQHVVIKIYDILGRELTRLSSERYPAGSHRIRWDGLDRNGTPVSSGIYFYLIDAGPYQKINKMVVIR